MKNIFKGKYYGVLFNKNSWWLGVHYSSYNKRWCINLLPMLTIWFIKNGGRHPVRPTDNFIF